SNHYFHVLAHGQYHHSFYFFALFDYEIACLLVQLISLFAFYYLHNSSVNRSFLGGTNVRHFRSFRQPLPSKVYHTILYVPKVCALRGYWLCQQNPAYCLPVCTKPLRPFFLLREKRNKKTCPLPPQHKGYLLSWLV